MAIADDMIQEAFTELAPRFEETMERELGEFLGLSYEEFVDGLVEAAAIGEDDIVLDVATGTALIPRKIAGKVGINGGVVGLDITPAMLMEGRKNIEAAGSSSRICLVCASGMAMPFVKGVFDVVVCGFGAHHMDVPTMLSEMGRVLKMGGRLMVVAVGAPRFWRSFLARASLRLFLSAVALAFRNARLRAEVEAFSNVRTAAEWHAALSEAGFIQVDIAERLARRRWYPRALTIRAVAEGG